MAAFIVAAMDYDPGGAGCSHFTEGDLLLPWQLRVSLAALSPSGPHIRVALRDKSRVRVGSQGWGCLDPKGALWRALSHHTPADESEGEQGRRYNPRIPHHGVLLLAVGENGPSRGAG